MTRRNRGAPVDCLRRADCRLLAMFLPDVDIPGGSVAERLGYNPVWQEAPFSRPDAPAFEYHVTIEMLTRRLQD